MGRYSYLVKYTRAGTGGTGTDTYRTTASCVESVAKFLGIEDLVYTPSEADLADREGYTRTYTKPDGTEGSVEVPAGKRVYLPNGKAGAKKIQLTTGARTTKGTKKTLSFTFPSFMSVAEISDALGELIPAGKIATTGTVGASEIEPFFSILGGRTYSIMKNTDAVAATKTDVATTEAEQVTIVTTTKSRKKKVATSP
jgi:hypothetical protein